MTNIISAWSDTQKTEAILDGNAELNKLVREFTARFKGFTVAEEYAFREDEYLKDRVLLLNEDGIVCAKLIVDRGYVDGKQVPIYMFNSASVKKERSSRFSDSNTRDSIKITGLLKAIEKNNDLPTKESIYKEFAGGIAYAFGQLAGREMDTPRLGPQQTIEVLKRFTGRDITALPASLMEEVDKVLEQYEKKLIHDNARNVNLFRFAKGCTLIGWGRGNNSHYLVGTARLDDPASKQTVCVDDLVRHNTLAETPHAGLAAMLREYFKGTSYADEANELGFAFHDKYHPDMDVACGYSGSRYCWILIPNEAPTV